jgi:molecular chaperone Hsp33
MIFQAQGSGALKALVAQCTHNKEVHGLARCSATAKGSLSEMMGKGRLVITVAPNKGSPYQGVVSLDDTTLAEAVTHYFLQSEQLETKIWLFANETHAAGLFLQKIPTKNTSDEDWNRISLLANTVTQHEMLTLDCEEMLFRLFNKEKTNLFEPEEVTFKCGCSLQKIKVTLATIGREELEEILRSRKTVDVDCEFCSKRYSFNKIDIANILSGQLIGSASTMKH